MTLQSLDYQQECALMRYPFKDNATLVWSDSVVNGELPNNIVIDAQLSIFNGTTGNVKLSSIQVNLNTNWVFTFTGIDTFIISASGSGINTYSVRSTDNHKLLKVDIDSSALTDYFSSISYTTGFCTFDSTNLLCISCIRLVSLGVNSISFINTLPNSSPSTLLTINSGMVNLAEGANTEFDITGNIVQTNVASRLGTGLYDGCISNPLDILTINNTSPTIIGNIFLETDKCYSATYGGPAALYLSNSCLSECLPVSLVNFANYLNRVTDGTNQLNTLASTAESDYSTFLNNYYAAQALLAAPVLPYIIAQSDTITTSSVQHHNITYGIYNPGPTLSVTVTVNFPGSSTFSLEANSTYIIADNIKTVTNSSTISRQIKCNNTIFAGFVAQQSSSTVNTGSDLNDITLALACSEGVSGYVFPTDPTTFNYTLSYAYEIINGVKLITFALNFIDPTQPSSSSTSLSVTLPGGYTLVNSATMFNQVKHTLTGLGFGSTVLNYTNTNQYELSISYPISTTGAQTFTFNGAGSSGSSSKSVTITL